MIKCLRVSLNIMGYELLRSWRRVLDRLVRWTKSLRVCYGQLLFLGISFLSSSRQHTQGLPSQGPTLTCHHGYTLFIKATLLKKTPWSPQRSSSIENPTAQHHRKGFFVTRLVSLKRTHLHGRSFKCQLYPHRSSAPSTTPGCPLQ